MIEVDDEILDDMYNAELRIEICKKFRLHCSVEYIILCDDKLVCSCGSDIIDADNIMHFLEKRYPNKKFYISGDFIRFEHPS